MPPPMLVAYQTAYMKTNYPVEFLAASMTLDMGNTDKLSEFRAEAATPRRRGRAAVDQPLGRAVRGRRQDHPLCARGLKGVGRQAVEAIVEARGGRPFPDLTDFAGRINPRAVNKRVLESLAAAGAFDALERNRARVLPASMSSWPPRNALTTTSRSGSRVVRRAGDRAALRLPAAEPWLPAERLQKEFDARSSSPVIRSTITRLRSSA